MPDTLSASAARRIALAAQTLAGPRPDRPGTRRLRRTIEDMGVLQIDSVNVFERSHYLPVLARAGAYDRAALDRLALGSRTGVVEYWGHEATFMPVEAWPLFRWRMDEARQRQLGDADSWASANGQTIRRVHETVRERGSATSRDIAEADDRGSGSWWGWSDSKRALEVLFRWGELVSSGRRGFERVYAPAETEIPAELRAAHYDRGDAVRELVRRASSRLGVGTTADIADYFRLGRAETAAALVELAERGDVSPVSVPEWGAGRRRDEDAWLSADHRLPRWARRDELLSPFDPLVWCRPRAERLWDFHYRIEIYTPAHKRVHGYYVLPVLLGDRIAARLDLKHDRAANQILVQSSWVEPGAPADVAERVAGVLHRTAHWQGSESILVQDRGTLAGPLASVLRSGNPVGG
ncbi:winged helix-turn-helix domain-containing protein [Mycetocola reblochoni]|uniref:Cytoplasmic protein clustered with trehalase n=2 Tax=Mycetocola reblochoni TaxID=331618 RepID=A0A1R4IBC4_9MICO|nr:crosslink repair DNA glycosylase YcaQ family protein [Mycetocola reblochoni]RLP67587.1 winged helix-turn-helix domain-containing protein [Mycetocola reblochoni]SJN17039.1 hypothetical protein FM119_00790 [Mycetocola reblochoni REB411]